MTVHSSSASFPGVPKIPPSCVITLPNVSLKHPSGIFTLRLSTDKVEFELVCDSNTKWEFSWKDTEALFQLGPAPDDANLIVYFSEEKHVKGSRGGWIYRNNIVFKKTKKLEPSVAPNGDPSSEAIRTYISGLQPPHLLHHFVRLFPSAPSQLNIIHSVECAVAGKSGWLYFFDTGLISMHSRNVRFSSRSSIKSASSTCSSPTSVIAWTLNDADGDRRFDDIQRADSDRMREYFQTHRVPCYETLQATSSSDLMSALPEHGRDGTGAVVETRSSKLMSHISQMSPCPSTQHMESAQQKVLALSELESMLCVSEVPSKIFKSQWRTYSDELKVAAKDKHPIASPLILESWRQTVRGGPACDVVGPYAIYVFIRWFHHHSGGEYPMFCEDWFKTEVNIERILAKFGLAMSRTIAQCKRYLKALDVRQHILPIRNEFLDTAGENVVAIQEILSKQIIGQQLAVRSAAQKVVELLFPQNPLTVPLRMTFCGPASTGKTELAKAIAKSLGVLETPAFVRLLGSNLSTEQDVSKVTGSAPGLVGEHAQTFAQDLKDAVDYRDEVGPDCYLVVFIDEVHKIHHSIQDSLREFIYTGTIKSESGAGEIRVGVKFLVILASNWASESIEKYWTQAGNRPADPDHLRRLVQQAMQDDKIEGATLGRYGELVPFVPLSQQDAVCALRSMLGNKNYGWRKAEVPDSLLSWMYDTYYSSNLGLRDLHDNRLCSILDRLFRAPSHAKAKMEVYIEWDPVERVATSHVRGDPAPLSTWSFKLNSDCESCDVYVDSNNQNTIFGSTPQSQAIIDETVPIAEVGGDDPTETTVRVKDISHDNLPEVHVDNTSFVQPSSIDFVNEASSDTIAATASPIQSCQDDLMEAVPPSSTPQSTETSSPSSTPQFTLSKKRKSSAMDIESTSASAIDILKSFIASYSPVAPDKLVFKPERFSIAPCKKQSLRQLKEITGSCGEDEFPNQSRSPNPSSMNLPEVHVDNTSFVQPSSIDFVNEASSDTIAATASPIQSCQDDLMEAVPPSSTPQSTETSSPSSTPQFTLSKKRKSSAMDVESTSASVIDISASYSHVASDQLVAKASRLPPRKKQCLRQPKEIIDLSGEDEFPIQSQSLQPSSVTAPLPLSNPSQNGPLEPRSMNCLYESNPCEKCSTIDSLLWMDPMTSHKLLPLDQAIVQRVFHHLNSQDLEEWFPLLCSSAALDPTQLQLDDESTDENLRQYARTVWGLYNKCKLVSYHSAVSHLNWIQTQRHINSQTAGCSYDINDIDEMYSRV